MPLSLKFSTPPMVDVHMVEVKLSLHHLVKYFKDPQALIKKAKYRICIQRVFGVFSGNTSRVQQALGCKLDTVGESIF